jgi:uncharacterized protein (DUF2147 family)
MRRLILAAAIAAAPTMVIAGGAEGVWKTEANDDGAYLEVTIGPCDSDSTMTCGKISGAVTSQGPDSTYQHLGKLMVKDMKSDDGTSYSGGTIWDPEDDKTYKSKMHVKGDELDVEGCVTIICSGQHWQRAK